MRVVYLIDFLPTSQSFFHNIYVLWIGLNSSFDLKMDGRTTPNQRTVWQYPNLDAA
jgi:hypothetical protein